MPRAASGRHVFSVQNGPPLFLSCTALCPALQDMLIKSLPKSHRADSAFRAEGVGVCAAAGWAECMINSALVSFFLEA